MSKHKTKWFAANKNAPGWHAINWKGTIVEIISFLLLVFIFIFNASPYNLDAILWLACLLFIVTFLIIPMAFGEPNPRNQIIRRYLEYRKKRKS